MNDSITPLLTSLFLLASAATTFVKLLVDGFKMARPTASSGLVVTLAFVTGPAIVFLLLLFVGQPLTTQTSAGAVLAGLLAAGGAIGLTAAHKAAREPSTDESKVP